MSGNYMKRLIQQGLSRAPWRAGRLWLGALVLLISALSIGLFVGPTVGIATAYPDGDRSIADAWARARAAGSYEFSSDIVQVTMPTARVTNVGRRSHSQQLRLEGHTDLRREQLAMTLWTAGGSVAQPESGVAIKVEDGKTFIRQGLDQWRESDSLTAPGGHPLAPGGDFLAFLSAVRDVQLIGH